MKLIALTGLHGAGKDTVADALPARKLAFADTLYREVAAAWGVEEHELRCREGKEREQRRFALMHVNDEHEGFLDFVASAGRPSITDPRSPRQILQWWGDYRRAQDPEYFVKRTRKELIDWDWATPRSGFVITDVRQANEAAMVRALGGQIWQIVRPGHEPPRTGHHTETDGSEFAPDVVLVNSQGIAELQAAALEEWMK